MTTAPRPPREIDGKGRTVRELLAGRKYSIDYYQREHYLGQNLFARSLHERAYDHNPGFRRFIEASGLPFRAHAAFRKADLDARQALYQRLAEHIWNPAVLDEETGS
jgi:hypothetical protein